MANLEDNNYDYIFALRRRRLGEVEEIIEEDLDRYIDFKEYNIDGKEKALKYLEVKDKKSRYIICHNCSRSEVDLEKLEKRVNKIKNRINDIIKNEKQPVDKLVKRFSRVYGLARFYKYGIDSENKFYYDFNEDAYNYEKIIAGKYVLKTNNFRISCEEIIKTYKHLGRIEDSFRDMKDFLDVRPIFHKSQDNVKGHIFITVLSYLLEKVLENYFCHEDLNRITAKKILGHLSKIKLVINRINNHLFGKITECTNEVKSILKKVGMKKFNNEYYLEKKVVVLPELTKKN